MVSNEEIKRRLEEKRKVKEVIGPPKEEYKEDVPEKIVEIQEKSDTPQTTVIESYPGYLVCKDCSGYYKLEEGESPGDFDRCDCGGKLIYVESLDEITELASDKTLACPACGYENMPQDKFCRECGHQLQ